MPRPHHPARPAPLQALNIREATAAFVTLMLGACGPAPGPAPPPPPEVGVVVAESAPGRGSVEFPGRVQAVRIAEVRARVDGIVQRRLYDEGSDVEQGQPLFRIDPRELEAQVSAARAALTGAEATLANAAQDVERYEDLVADHVISQQQFDTATARLRTARADVARARAQLESARLQLSYTTVRAPIAGRAGRAQVTEGALVSASAATLLTTIEQLDPAYVNFSQSSVDLLRVRRDITQGKLQVPELGQVPVTLELADGSLYPREGHIDFLDLSIDEATGTAALRAEFPNPDRVLLPGQFVRVRLPTGIRPGAVAVPQRAVQLSPGGASVLIVTPDGRAATRSVTLGNMRADTWLVLEGLSPGDRVIVDGLQKVRPGDAVRVADSAAPDAASPVPQAGRGADTDPP